MNTAQEMIEALPKKEATRNGTTLPFVIGETKKGPFRGTPYPTFEVAEDDFTPIIDFYGRKKIADILQAKVNLDMQAALSSACESEVEEVIDEKTGKKRKIGRITDLDVEKLLQIIESGICRGETKAELLEQLREKNMELTGLVSKLINPQTGAPDPVVAKLLTELSEEIRSLNIAIEEKSRKKSISEDDEEEKD
jgi:hypothetical protein